MGIRMVDVSRESGACAVVMCDVCGKQIEDAAKGVVYFNFDAQYVTRQTLFAHLGVCDPTNPYDLPEWPASISLNMFLAGLLHNVKFDARKAEKEWSLNELVCRSLT